MSGTFWFTADPHFGHRMVAELRGFTSLVDHDHAILEGMKSRVGPGDNLFVLGDFMLPYKEDYAIALLKEIPGTKHLIIGNHDTGKLTKLKQWAWTGHVRARKIDGTPFFLCHYACRSWPGMGKGSIHLYGHSHGNLAPDYGRSMDVGVDTRMDWTPWHINEIRVMLGTVEPLIVDHHDAGEGDTDSIGD